MQCSRVTYSGHALRRMAQRGITPADVSAVLTAATVVDDYPNDTPYPSQLLLGIVDGRAIHVVAACDGATDECYIITAYEPDPSLWQSDWMTRR